MSPFLIWTEKLVQLMHDPALKAWCQGQTAKAIARRLGQELDVGDPRAHDDLWERYAQDKVGALLAHRLLGTALVFPKHRWRAADAERLAKTLDAGLFLASLEPDHAATGADRPVLGTQHQVRVEFWSEGREYVTVTHPLAAAPLRVPTPPTFDALWERLRVLPELLDEYRHRVERSSNEDLHRLAFLLAWRCLPEDLANRDGLFWPLQPADTRCPDHSIWDHLRVTSALAFSPTGHADDDRRRNEQYTARLPWLLTIWVGPVQDFVGLARTGRDLWTGSLMLSELAWAMMEPIVKELGPDAVLYPDLRANPRADRWLVEEGVLHAFPRTRTSLIPNRFVAVVPRDRVDDLASAGQAAIEKRWREMTRAVHDYLRDHHRLGPGGWEQILLKQVEAPPITRWAAVPWKWDGYGDALRRLRRDDIRLSPVFPFTQDPPELPRGLQELEDTRKKRFEAWMEHRVYAHYQAARWTYLQTHPGYLLMQRGFDYPLHHHILLATLGGRKRLGDIRTGRAEPGEKCTLCGVRQALTNEPSGSVGQQRRSATNLWKRVDPERVGAERLCGPCAVRRYLSDTDDPIHENWTSQKPSTRPAGGRHALPFPSTALVAGQEWLDELCARWSCNENLQYAVRAFLDACRACSTRIPATQFAEALPRFRRWLHAGTDPDLRKLLEFDIQYLAPERWERPPFPGIKPNEARRLQKAAQAIRASLDLGPPPTHLALILLDGDRMGRLLLGTPDRVHARWRDVLHPDAVKTIQATDDRRAPPPWKSAWKATLEAPRLPGPSLHAFISRALRHFSNRVLPWVVEREYGGRLIYAGGDDALILCPASDALPMLHRLDELFTAPWLIDRMPDASTWVRRDPPGNRAYVVGSTEAAERFERLEEGSVTGAGRIFPMLGPGTSFSAGVAIGHFKTSLRLLRSEAARMQRRAKDARYGQGRRAGLSWFTRGGTKVQVVAPLDDDRPGSVGFIQACATGLADQRIPGRLPYKLRELAPLARGIVASSDHEENRRERAITALVHRATDGKMEMTSEIARAWAAGLEGGGDGLETLFFARALASHLPARGAANRKARHDHGD